MYWELRKDIREIIRQLCECKGIEIVQGSVSKDHVHLCVKIAPKMSVSYFMGYLKGLCSWVDICLNLCNNIRYGQVDNNR